MHSRLKYVSNNGTVELDGPLTYVGTASGIRGREWSYTLKTHAIASAIRKARKASIDYTTTVMGEADRARRIMDADVSSGVPGKLVFDDVWEQRAYVLVAKPDDDITEDFLSMSLTLVLLDGCWTRLVTREYRPRTAAGGYEWLDLPTDFPADLGPSLPTSTVELGCLVRPNVRLTVYGPCVDPYVIVGGNRYAVDVTLAEGERVEIDGRDKTITKVTADGTRVNCFGKGVRIGGEGGGSYVFERLPVSQWPISVSWDNSFGFDLAWYEEEGEPPWSR